MINTFENVVNLVFNEGFHIGLQALSRADADKIKVRDTRLLQGSVNIDSLTQPTHPRDNRWDYALSYHDTVYYVEVHPAQTGEVTVMLRKLEWLQQWLKKEAQPLDSLTKADPPFHWLQSGEGCLLRASKEYKKAALHGLLPTPRLTLA